MSELKPEDLPAIRRLLETKASRDAGVTQLSSYLEQHPHDGAGWYLMGRVLSINNHHALVDLVMARAAELEPGNIDPLWERYKALNQLMWPEKSLALAKELVRLAPDDHRGYLAHCVSYERLAQYEDSVLWGERCLELDPDNGQAKATMGFSLLRLRDYKRGWDLYHYGLGQIEYRDKRTYVGEPEWDGTPGQHIAVYSEQGLGDQIAGIEPLRDVPCTVTALSVDPKLRHWFKRCFPKISYHGSDITERCADPINPLRVDASINLFGLHKYLRQSEASYPKTPYLTPHPRKAAMWRTALDQLGDRPKVGVAWSGGVRLTHAEERRHSLADWMMRITYPFEWISLEYKDRDEETTEISRRLGKPVHVWPDAIRSRDFEDTAALISQLDAVIGPPTTVIHAAGAMGIPAFCVVNAHGNPHYPVRGNRMPYYASVTLIRDGLDGLCRHLYAFLSATITAKMRPTG